MVTKLLFMAGIVLSVYAAEDALPPSCQWPVYCDSQLLHHVQMAEIFNDSKTFVDMHLLGDENDTLAAFQQLLDQTNNNPSKEQLTTFVFKHFDNSSELENWQPPDYSENPRFLSTIRDEQLRQFAKNIHAIWPTLGRKVKSAVFENPNRYSLIPVSNGFIIPGGRFRELYYWDTYWIIEGLLISGMENTVKGKIDNLIQLLKKIGHIPNGSRWYYQERSQPPLLVAMMSLYLRYTHDMTFLRKHINTLEEELQYWLDTQIITVEMSDKAYTLLRYYAPSAGPHPESYKEDFKNSRTFNTKQDQQDFFVELKSAAESGWDFSSRWFVDANGTNTGNLTNIHTRDIIPVDLNSIFANALQNLAYMQAVLGNPRRAAHWGSLAKQWRSNIESVFWNEEAGIWLDYDMVKQRHRNYFYPSNFAPLWMGAVKKSTIRRHAPRIIQNLRASGAIDFPGGVPVSLLNSGEQWDLPNAWPPLVSVMVNAMEAVGTDEGKEIAFEIAQTWVRANHKGFKKWRQMFEKYDVNLPGEFGGGGEYNVQEGFGWSNGVVLEFLAKYGQRLTASVDDRASATGNAAPSQRSPSIPAQHVETAQVHR